MGLIRKAIFLGTGMVGGPLVRWNSSAEQAAGQMQDLMDEQNSILSDLTRKQRSSRIYRSSEPEVEYVTNSAPTAEPSLTERLTEIKGLLERDIITEEEFSTMRKNILGL